MNLTLMSAYYRVTKRETKRNKYRAELQRIWNESYPERPLTSQHLSAQTSNIKSHRLISPDELEAMTKEALQNGPNRRSVLVRRSIARRSNIQPQENEVAHQTQQPLRSEEELYAEIRTLYQEVNFKYEGECRTKKDNIRS